MASLSRPQSSISDGLGAKPPLVGFLGHDEHRALLNVQRMLNAPATGLALLMLLALGTFVAGVFVSWRICVLGIIMALSVPAIAWLTESALLLVLGVIALIGIAMTFWWRPSEGRK
jgi:hypothetical protein